MKTLSLQSTAKLTQTKKLFSNFSILQIEAEDEKGEKFYIEFYFDKKIPPDICQAPTQDLTV